MNGLETKTLTNLQEGEYELPVGYTDKDGVIHKKFTLREMTGEVDEAIAEKKVRVNAGKIVTETIYGVLESLGTLTRIDRAVVKKLTNADRDYIMLMNFKNSIDDVLEWQDSCPYCDARADISLEIDKVKVKYLPENEVRLIHTELPKGIRGENGEIYKEITLSLPNGLVQEQIFGKVDKNPAEAISHILAMCTEEIKGLKSYNFDTFKKMTKKDRSHINKVIGKVDVGAQMWTEVECPDCGGSYESSIPLMQLLGE